MSVLADYPVHYAGLGRSVHIHRKVWLLWRSQRQIRLEAPETAGVLIGLSSKNKKTIWIQDSTIGTPFDEQSRHYFKLTDSIHQSMVNEAYEKSNGAQIYLGTWHTHPQDIPNPSHVDLDDWKHCVHRNPGRPLVFAVVGTEAVRLYSKWGNHFKSLKLKECAIDES